MDYIDQSDYKNLLNKFAQGTKKQKLQENYIDLRPINSLRETKPTEMAFLNAQGSQKYADAMYEMEEADKESAVGRRSIENGIDNNPKVTKADFVPAAKKNEGLYGDGPHATGYQLENLSLSEKEELKSYVESMKTTKKAIEELLEKAKTPRMEGGNMTNLMMPGE